MSDIVVVTGDVDISGSNMRMDSVLLNETVDRGMTIVEISGRYRKGNNASQTGANFRGVSLQAGVSGDWITSVRDGSMTFGTGLISSGELYGMGTGDGGIANITGLTTNDWVTVLGWGMNSDFISINPIITNTQRQ